MCVSFKELTVTKTEAFEDRKFLFQWKHFSKPKCIEVHITDLGKRQTSFVVFAQGSELSAQFTLASLDFHKPWYRSVMAHYYLDNGSELPVSATQKFHSQVLWVISQLRGSGTI